MAQKKAQEWSNTPVNLDEEMKIPTPREQQVAELIEKNKDVKPQRYDIISKNGKAIRVVHDFHGHTVTIPPGETKRGVLLHPHTVEQLSHQKSDLEFTVSA